MSINLAAGIIILLVIMFTISHGRASYWKGLAQERANNDGWRNEVMFLRHHVDPNAAEHAAEN